MWKDSNEVLSNPSVFRGAALASGEAVRASPAVAQGAALRKLRRCMCPFYPWV